MNKQAERYTLTLRVLSGCWRTSGIQRLRGLLKVALRGFGLRAESVRAESDTISAANQGCGQPKTKGDEIC